MPKPPCRKCHKPDNVKLRRQITSAGNAQVGWYCVTCEMWAETPPHWLAHTTANSILAPYRTNIDALPIVADYRETCSVCGQPGAEYNHWMPQMFKTRPEVGKDWQAWNSQGANLCKYHHDLWHDLVTPWMPGRGNSRKRT